MNFDYTPKASGPKKAIGLSVTQTINNDGTASTNAIFQDSDGLPITAAQFNNLYPVGVALPTVTAGDSTPGPSAFKVVAVTPPTASTAVPGAFVVATTSAVTPPSVPPPTGWGQAVDFTCSIASGLVGQSTTQSVDAGTLSVVSNSNNPAAFTVSTNSSGVGLVAAGVPATTIKSAFTSPAKPTITPGYQHSPDPSTGRKIY